MHFYTNDVVATSKIPILSPRVRFPVGVFFFAPMPSYPPFAPGAETRSHEYPRLAGDATDFGCGHRSDLGRARDFWCWNDLEWTGCGRATGHRTETTIMFFFGARSRSDAGSRRWPQQGCSSPLARSWPAREDSSTRELASPIGLLTCAQQWIALLVSISKINPFLDDGCPRAQRATGCPRAQRARACCPAPAGSRAAPTSVQ